MGGGVVCVYDHRPLRQLTTAETDRQIAKLTGLPIGCTRLREKHATPELLPLCTRDFGHVRRRGGYTTPLLHATGFKRSWRDVLRGRREAPSRCGSATSLSPRSWPRR